MAETEASPTATPETQNVNEQTDLSKDTDGRDKKSPEINSAIKTETVSSSSTASERTHESEQSDSVNDAAASGSKSSEGHTLGGESSAGHVASSSQGDTTGNNENAAEDDIESNLLQVSDDALDQLTQGFLQVFVPHIETSYNSLDELMRNQRVLIETVQQENVKCNENHLVTELAQIMTQARIYHTKLVNIKKEMTSLHERTTKLKKRALKLQQQKMKENLAKEQQREKELEHERQLIARPAAKRSVSTPTPDKATQQAAASAVAGAKDTNSANKPV